MLAKAEAQSPKNGIEEFLQKTKDQISKQLIEDTKKEREQKIALAKELDNIKSSRTYKVAARFAAIKRRLT